MNVTDAYLYRLAQDTEEKVIQIVSEAQVSSEEARKHVELFIKTLQIKLAFYSQEANEEEEGAE